MRSPYFLVGGLTAVACLVTIAIGAYLYFVESILIAEARRQINNREYDKALQTLEDLPHRWFVGQEAAYLEAVARLKKYASEKEVDNDTLLKIATDQLKNVFTASETWRVRANKDLADTVAEVPSKAPDTLERALQIAQQLNELKVIDSAVLAKALLAKAQGRIEFQSPASRDPTPAEYVKHILAWDATNASAIVKLALPKDGSSPEGLLAIKSWVEWMPSLGNILSSAVAQVAEPYISQGEYDKARRFIDTAKEIDKDFDTWIWWEKQWEKHFQKVTKNNWKAALQVLRFAVTGESNPERLKKATDRWELIQQCAEGKIEPPPEISEEVDRRNREKLAEQFRRLIGEAEQLVKDGKYQEARIKLDKAREISPDLWKADEKAQELYFCLHLQTAQEAYTKDKFDEALREVTEALKFRPNDIQALELRDKIQGKLDEAKVKEYLTNAKRAVDEGNFHDAVDLMLLPAREILEKPSNADWRKSYQEELEKLAQHVREKLLTQAKDLMDKRQYEEAKRAVTGGQRLFPKDEELSQLGGRIKQLESDPKTANISGTWVSKGDGNSFEITLTDTGKDPGTGKDTVRWSISQRDNGVFTRIDDILVTNFKEKSWQAGEGERIIRARIETPDTIVILRSDWKPSKPKPRPPGGMDPVTPEYPWRKDCRWERKDKPAHGGGEPPPKPPFPPGPGLSPVKPPKVEPLKNGVVVGDFSIAVVRPIEKKENGAEITLAFQWMGKQKGGKQDGGAFGSPRFPFITVYDDRSNAYRGFHPFSSFSMRGAPPALSQLPAGFTWVSKIHVSMPELAVEHITKIELELFDPLGETIKKQLDPRPSEWPSLDFKVPSEIRLTPGTKLRLDKNLVAEIGKLEIDSSAELPFSLPISVTNEDYNPHPCESFELYVQWENGEVWQYARIKGEEILGKTTRKLSTVLTDSGSRGSLSKEMQAVLLYWHPGSLRFCGFVPIPDEVRTYIKKARP